MVALLVALALARTRFAWLAVIAGYLTALGLIGDFAFSPLTAARKVILCGIIAAGVGVALDLLPQRRSVLAAVVAVVAGLVSIWVFETVLSQRDPGAALLMGGGIAVFAAALVYLVLRLREDGIRCGAAGLGLGLATGIAGIVSASIGYLLGGVAVAASCGALLLVQVAFRRDIAAGFTGALTVGVLTALFASATFMLAKLPWYALPLLLVVPMASAVPAPREALRIVRAAVVSFYAFAAASLPVLAAWYHARGSFH